MKRHKWTPALMPASNAYTWPHGFKCLECDLKRRRPDSRIWRGRASVSDWDYFIDGVWQRQTTVPPCEGKK